MNRLRRLAMWCVLYYIRFWAKLALVIGHPVTVGIAGSVGKSSTKDVLLAMLTEVAKPRATYGNSETGVPLGILNISIGDSSAKDWLRIIITSPTRIFNLTQTSHLIIEMATDEPYPPKNMDYLLSIVRPQFSILLNTFPIHTMQFEAALQEVPAAQLAAWTDADKAEFALQRLAEEDAKIISRNSGTVGIYNSDNHLVSQQMLQYLSQEPLATLYNFGQQPDSDISYGAYEIGPSGSAFGLKVEGNDYRLAINNYLLPEEYREVLSAALLAGIKLGFGAEDLVASLGKHLHLDKSRASLFKGLNDSIIIDSSYNASGSSVRAFVTMIHALKQQTHRQAVLVLGDMREIGLAVQQEHEAVAQTIMGVADQVYLVGEFTQKYIKPWLETNQPGLSVKWFATYEQLNQDIVSNLPSKALVLIKGSQNTIFLEETVKALLADPQDAQRLCRQADYWLARKQAWLESQKA